jgi:hypothetical protein
MGFSSDLAKAEEKLEVQAEVATTVADLKQSPYSNFAKRS